MSSNKNIYRIGLISVFLIINLVILFAISQIVSYFSSGADRASILHLAVKNEEVYLPKTIWVDTINPGRPIEKQTLETLKGDYLKGWYVRNIAYQNNDPLGVADYYTKSARETIYEHIKDQKSKNIKVISTTLDHNLALDFYSADGQLAILTDRHSRAYQRIYQNEQLLLETYNNASYKVLLLLEDGFWKIRHIVKEVPSVANDTVAKTTVTIPKIKNGHIYIDNKPFVIKGINYYPQATPWNIFGNEFSETVITKDFDIIKNAGLNTLRVFVPYEEFGKAVIIPEKLQKLKKVLDIAARKELKVILTLFDFYGNYDTIDWTLTHRHAEQLVRSLKNHPAILAWDIKNEPNLDFASRGKINVLAWLKEMITQVRAFDPSHPITIGWSDLQSANLLKEELDLISFHYYGRIADFEKEYHTIRSKTNKPLVLQEYGLPSNFGLWAPLGASEQAQATYYRDFGAVLKKHNIQNISWTLYDFDNIPSRVAGILPWRRFKQKHFGFIDKDGHKKPSFEFIKN